MESQAKHVLSADLLAQLTLRGDIKEYSPRAIVLTEGEASDCLYILVSGQLKVFSRDSSDRQVVYNLLNPGEIFGEMFLDGGTRSASVKAVIASQCICIDHVKIREFIRDFPEFADCLIRSLISRLRHATQMIKGFAFNDVYERVRNLLIEVADADGVIRSAPSKLTQQEMADRVGASREMINQVLKALIKGGFLRRDEKRRLVLIKTLPSGW